ncbi:hypothetical protein J2X11_001659 [Aeromicrobium panaciterrae]|uniref:Uncharacterized protein n=1 Tax=Aeromicrobium panaciterrae TaxID=363861 RepID=A0ABU1UNQ7_9ACTN|nr:CFI-box-CTERM domain-containing protein [Aeromicrobium panaciterrae]MDR7086820.1 hypothetical protein [Aeromicrobium panaciterrae]
MTKHDRHFSDNLFEIGFNHMENGRYEEGLKSLLVAAGAEQLEVSGLSETYNPANGISPVCEVAMAAKGHLDEHGKYSPHLVRNPRSDPSAIVFMGAETEFKGFIERRTGKSPDYRASGFVNHLGHAISQYRRAEALGSEVATWRLEALQLKLGSQDFQYVEQSYKDSTGRAMAHSNQVRDDILRQLGGQQQPKVQAKQGGCYIATAVYGSYDAPPVMTLRRFRDDHLAYSPIGRGFIRFYYFVSPGLAKRLTPENPLTVFVRNCLDEVVKLLERTRRR